MYILYYYYYLLYCAEEKKIPADGSNFFLIIFFFCSPLPSQSVAHGSNIFIRTTAELITLSGFRVSISLGTSVVPLVTPSHVNAYNENPQCNF
jgi:hypothetical protein